MAKISIDVDEITRNIKSQALSAKAQLTELAKKAQKDLEHTQVFKKVENVIEKVKKQELAQEILKNPKIQELTKKLLAASEQLEKAFTKNANTIIEEVRARVNKPAAKTAKKSKKSTSANND